MRLSRLLVAAPLVPALLLAAPSGPAGAAVPTSPGPAVTIAGSGWGHSVGMSQYGAREMARRGFDAVGILEHYYSGTDVVADARGGDDVVVRTNVFADRPASGTVHLLGVSGQGAGADVLMGGASMFLGGEKTVVRHDVGRRLYVYETTGGVPLFEASDAAPVVVRPRPGGQVRLHDLAVGHAQFAWGEVELFARAADSTVMEAVVVQRMAEYLRGIAEVPSSWEPAALQAQAIAARTYAARIIQPLGPLGPGKWHLGATPRHQNYVGWAKESEPTWGVRWVGAVQDTAGRVVKHGSTLASTYYSSSHGLGRSENSEDSWAYGAALPYLRSVADPYSAGGGNPYGSWTATATNEAFAAAVGLVRVSNVAVGSRTAGGSPKTLVVRGWVSDGRLVECTWSGAGACTEDVATGKGAGARLRTTLAVTGDGAYGGKLRSQQLSGFRVEPFSDDEASVHQYSIGAVAAAGITTGCRTDAPDLFCPGLSVTRGQMASFLGRAVGLTPDTDGNAFSDIAGSTHRGYINALARAGEVGGYPDGTYRPDEPVSRAQMARFLFNAFDLPASSTDAFTDDQDSVHQDAINAVAAEGITGGCAPSRYCPGASVTREQMASFLARATGIGD